MVGCSSTENMVIRVFVNGKTGGVGTKFKFP